jgi:hypothetical protein
VAIQPFWPFYSQNALIINFIFFKKKIQKRKNQTKNIAGVAEPPLGQTRWPATTYRVVRPPQQIFFFGFFFFGFFLKKNYDEGILEIKRPKGLNCHNLKVWGG